MIMAIDDTCEFAQLILKVVRKEIPAYIEGEEVWLTDGVRIKEGGKLIKEIVSPILPIVKPILPNRNDPCPCGSGKKFKKCHGGNV
jgi:uncharacterized protein YecA (UPF0149 family)